MSWRAIQFLSQIGIFIRSQKHVIQVNILMEFDGKCLHTFFNRYLGQGTTLNLYSHIGLYHIQGHMGTKFWENKGGIEELC